ncbi:hypothetical protein DEJ33_09400 [Curtobacterium sp. MCPF17_047]|uniref:hypothetical protein n=1 Tax=Curtobacterium sp. MCPF17_047 TaxID=2175654 RepID=UPI000DA77185|nr:hypothetical protein [Curtobacterium sp. MCPF17_047]PZF65961.1 hypothetical protein DEJ33_09400 [Curtobacterium sp. MCPF17_047]
MGFLDRLLGREERPEQPRRGTGGAPQPGYQYGQQSYQQAPAAPYGAATPSGVPDRSGPGQQPGGEDQRAVERYRYLLRTAPPERIEEVHAEAFATLTPEQRRMVYDEFTRTAPAGEAPRGDDPRSLAQSATRSELRQPGYMERSLGGIGGGGMGGGFGGRQGSGFGSILGASLLGTVGGYVIGSALMSAFLPDPGSFDGGTDASGADDGGSGDTGDGSGDGGAADGGGYDNASWGDGGSDFGGMSDGGFDQGSSDFGGGFDV